MFCVCVGIGFVDLTSESVYMRRDLKCAFAYGRVCPEVTLCGWQDVKIQLLT